MTAALVPVAVEGWTLFRAEADHWIRDLDLADRAELSRPRDIRPTIKSMLDEGALTIAAGARDGVPPGKGAIVRAETELVEIGSGAHREATVYYLSEEAALLVITRLRTPAAVALTRAVVRVFLAVAKGEHPVGRGLPISGGVREDAAALLEQIERTDGGEMRVRTVVQEGR